MTGVEVVIGNSPQSS